MYIDKEIPIPSFTSSRMEKFPVYIFIVVIETIRMIIYN